MVNAFLAGLGSIARLREYGLPIFVHRVGSAFLRRSGPVSVSAGVLAELTRLLGADYVLSGAYRAGGTRLKLDVELAEAKTGRVLWSESLDDDLAGIVSGEQELIGRLIAAVGAAVTAREVQRSRSQPLPVGGSIPAYVSSPRYQTGIWWPHQS